MAAPLRTWALELHMLHLRYGSLLPWMKLYPKSSQQQFAFTRLGGAFSEILNQMDSLTVLLDTSMLGGGEQHEDALFYVQRDDDVVAYVDAFAQYWQRRAAQVQTEHAASKRRGRPSPALLPVDVDMLTSGLFVRLDALLTDAAAFARGLRFESIADALRHEQDCAGECLHGLID